MIVVPSHFEELFFEDADFGELQWSSNDLIVPACGVIALATHPLGQGRRVYIEGRLRFRNVVTSTRFQVEYRGDPKVDGFHEPHTVVERPPVPPLEGATQILGFCGVLLRPPAFVEWQVECSDFDLEVDACHDTPLKY